MQQNLDRTQLMPDDGEDVPREMGWDDAKQVCKQPIALPMQSFPASFCCPAELPALPRCEQLPSSKCLYGVQYAVCCMVVKV